MRSAAVRVVEDYYLMRLRIDSSWIFSHDYMLTPLKIC